MPETVRKRDATLARSAGNKNSTVAAHMEVITTQKSLRVFEA
jgi:hypothetical protein